jgi:hypothetical protein
MQRRFAGEVTRVAREVGTDGRLGGQANVAERGTDILLSFWPDFTNRLVLIVNCLVELADKGDPGTFEAIVSLEDDLFHRFSNPIARFVARRSRNSTGPYPVGSI